MIVFSRLLISLAESPIKIICSSFGMPLLKYLGDISVGRKRSAGAVRKRCGGNKKK